MRTPLPPLLALALIAALAASATAQAPQPAPPAAAKAKPDPTPSEIVAAAPAGAWIDIAANDLLVMTLAPDARNRPAPGGKGQGKRKAPPATQAKPRRILIQLMPPPVSQGWTDNIRTLARAHWYDGISVVRAQDNYVVQWGDPDSDDAKKAKKLPTGLGKVPESAYVTPWAPGLFAHKYGPGGRSDADYDLRPAPPPLGTPPNFADPYSRLSAFVGAFPVAMTEAARPGDPQHFAPATLWPIHCYGMVGVGRGLSPDTGSGAELYTVIGHAPRHLDRNIAVVGRVIEGIEQLSSLPRGTGQLGFYETAAERTPILSVRLASDLPAAEQPHLQYLSTESDSFARYADARANRHDDFFIVPAGGADICNVPVPIRRRP